MVEGPALGGGEAGDCLDWIARGLEKKNELEDLVTPVRFRQGPRIFDKFCFLLNWQDFRTNSVRHQASTDQLQTVEVKSSTESESQYGKKSKVTNVIASTSFQVSSLCLAPCPQLLCHHLLAVVDPLQLPAPPPGHSQEPLSPMEPGETQTCCSLHNRQ